MRLIFEELCFDLLVGLGFVNIDCRKGAARQDSPPWACSNCPRMPRSVRTRIERLDIHRRRARAEEQAQPAAG
jgi:hypothetical protein